MTEFKNMKLAETVNKIKDNWSSLHSIKIQDSSGESKYLSYKYDKLIGCGTFGVVVKITDLKTNEKYALKRVFQDNKFHNRELSILKDIKNENIINLKCYFFDDESVEGKYLNLIMDYYPHNLELLIRDNKVNKDSIKEYCRQILSGLKYLHSKNICHRDIKPSNILLDESMTIVKICDLGSAKVINDGENNISYICSRYYRAPENILGMEKYNVKIDIWSLGCVMAELHIGVPLFKCETNEAMFNKIIGVLNYTEADLLEMGCSDKPVNRSNIGIRKYLAEYVKDEKLLTLYECMLVLNPNKRYTAEKLLNIAEK